MSADKIGNLDSEGNESAVEIEYPSRTEAKNLKSSIRKRRSNLKRKLTNDIAERIETKTTGRRAEIPPLKNELQTLDCTDHDKSEKVNSYLKDKSPAPILPQTSAMNTFDNDNDLKNILESFDLPPLGASKEVYIIQYMPVFEAILQKLRNIEVAMFEPSYMDIDEHQQRQLHPVMQSYLVAVRTVGDGNCLFHSVWKQLFPKQKENVHSARFMRQIALYTIYRNEILYREIVSALGFDFDFNDYLRNIMQVGSYCGDLALSVLADALERPIYCYNSFIDNATGKFFFDGCDFESLQSMFETRRMGTWQHNIFRPNTIVNNARRPLKIIFNTNHFTALFNTIMHEEIVPQTNNFNIHEVLREE